MTTDTFNSGSGTFVVPAGVSSVLCRVWGGGGGGGHGDEGGGSAAGSGGGGGACIEVTLAVAADDEIAWAVGGGSSGVVFTGYACTQASTAGTSSITFDAVTYEAPGGEGGYSCGSASYGLGGNAVDGSYQADGGDGSPKAANVGGSGGNSGTASSSVYGVGGPGGNSLGVAGSVGMSPGGGGGGGAKQASGGNGAPGRVSFTYTVSGGTSGSPAMFHSF